MKTSYRTKGVCARMINIETDDETGKITSVQFVGGCNGNTKGISALVEGMDIDDVIERLEGITCGIKPTSCPDQLAQALKELKD